MSAETPAFEPDDKLRRGTRLRTLVVGAIVVVLLVWLYRDELTLDRLVANEVAIRQFVEDHRSLALATAFVVYVAATATSLPIATVLSVVYGWLFGFLPAVVLVSFASTTGATAAFLLTRLLALWLQDEMGGRLTVAGSAINRKGAYYLFALRLMPFVPFVAVNVMMGLTRMKVRTFWWVSQLGMLPATAAYVSVGASLSGPREIQERGLSGIITWQLAAALVALGLLPILGSAISRRLRRGER